MKTTEWREYVDGSYKYRIRATYGLQKLGNQEPYFSITGEIERRPARGGRWTDDSFGCLHDQIARRFPELRELIPWHLMFAESGPMHYMANGLYWWDRIGEEDKAYGNFRSTTCAGAIDESVPDPLTWGRDGVEQWMKDRLPRLMAKFREVMAKHEVTA